MAKMRLVKLLEGLSQHLSVFFCRLLSLFVGEYALSVEPHEGNKARPPEIRTLWTENSCS